MCHLVFGQYIYTQTHVDPSHMFRDRRERGEEGDKGRRKVKAWLEGKKEEGRKEGRKGRGHGVLH